MPGEAGCCGSGDRGVAHMGVEYSTEGQSGCSSQSVDGRRCGGARIGRAPERKTESPAKSIWVCFTSPSGEAW